MADSRFDRQAFESRLVTHRLGRRLLALAETGSTNDAAWDALAAGAPDGLAVVADAQPRGRGRAGRAWHTAPGRGLALSVLLRKGCERRPLALLPLASGLALVLALERLGVAAELKWPNDVLLRGRKLAGILCESRAEAGGGRVAVVGVGVNVLQRAEDFPPALGRPEAGAAASAATSLAIEGHALTRETVAAEILNALEPLWAELEADGAARVLEAWRRRASFWGEPVRVSTSSGAVAGIARGLDATGGLVVALEGGGVTTVLAGDLELAGAAARTER